MHKNNSNNKVVATRTATGDYLKSDDDSIKMDEVSFDQLNSIAFHQNLENVLEKIDNTLNDWTSELRNEISDDTRSIDININKPTSPIEPSEITALNINCLFHNLNKSIEQMLENIRPNIIEHLAQILITLEEEECEVNSTTSQGSVAVSDTAGFLVVEKQDVRDMDEKQNL